MKWKDSVSSPLNETCSCGRKTMGRMTIRYPTGFTVEIPICYECSVLAERVLIRKANYDRKDFEK